MIFQRSADRKTLQIFQELFPDNGDYLNQWEFSPLHKIILGLSIKNLEEGITRHANNLDSQDRYGNTALIWTALRNDIMAARALLNAGANPNIQNHSGSSALHFVLGCCTLPYAKLLVCAGSDPHSLNYYRDNALHTLTWLTSRSRSQSEQGDIISYLVAAGTEVD